MKFVLGADGCRGGWIAISKDLDTGKIAWHVYKTASEMILSEPPPSIIAIDIPIGLPERGSRRCDQQARILLGRLRGSSVFPAPIRPLLAASSYEEACRIRHQLEGKKISLQTWGIVPKIRQVDDLLRHDPGLQQRLREVHPEVCFYQLAGHPMCFKKKSPQGRQERLAWLEPLYGQAVRAALADCRKLACSSDDVLDAFAALWSAERIQRGCAITIPLDPPVDSHGLRMEIVV